VSAGYRLSQTAEAELEEILLYVAEQSGVDRALRVHRRFVDAFEHLTEMPNSGSERRDALTPSRVAGGAPGLKADQRLTNGLGVSY